MFRDTPTSDGSWPSIANEEFAADRIATVIDPRFEERTMTAALHDEVLYAERAPAPPCPRRQSPIVGAGDPLVDAAARLLSIPLRQLYAALWRVGVIELRA